MPGEWISQLAGDLQTNEQITAHSDKDLSGFVGTYLETAGKAKEYEGKVTELTGKVTDLEGRVANSIPKLTDKATDEEKANYRKAIGVPEAPDKYELDRPKLPDGVKYNEDLEKWFRGVAHELDMPAPMAKAFYGRANQFFEGFFKSLEDHRTATLEKGLEAIKAEWGNNYAANDAAVKKVQAAICSDPESLQLITDYKLENNPAFIRILLRAAPAFIDDYQPPKSGGTGEAKPGLNYDKTPKI